MKKIQKVALLGVVCSIAVLGSCNKTQDSSTSNGGKTSTSTADVDVGFYVTYKGEEIDNGAACSIDVGEKSTMLTATADEGTGSFTFSTSDESVLGVGAGTGLLSPNKAGSAVITVKNAGTNDAFTINFTVNSTSVATGAQSYTTASYDDRSRILGSLENYAVDNYLTGITMFSNGGYAVYNSRYVPTPTSYVVGYGWGTAREGKLTATLPNARGGHPEYYTIGTSAVASYANAMDASGSDVSDLYGYLSSSYFGTRLNETGDGYEWYPSLGISTESRPISMTRAADGTETVATNQNATNTRWRIHLRSGVKYATGSKATKNGIIIENYNGKTVTLDDYLTPIKFMLTSWNGQYRGAEMTTGVSGFKGASNYYSKTNTQTSTGALWDDDLWNTYMKDNIFTGTDSTGDFIEFNLLNPCTQFYAMYYLSSSLFSPLPEDFIKLWAVDGKPGSNKLGKSPDGYTPVDTMLSTGPYYIESWTNNKQISLKKNPYYYYTKDTFSDGKTRDVYQLKGIDMCQVDSTSLLNEFEIGKVDNYSPDKNTLKGDYSKDSGTSSSGVKWNRFQTKGDANFKININSTTQDEWNSMFGTNGSVYPHTATEISTGSYGKRKKYLSDHNFLDFMSFAMDRQTICSARGSQPTQEYLSDNYLIDPENGVSYNSTAAHKAVLADRYNETYGFNEAAAKKSLEKAMDDTILPMAEAGQLEAGTSGQAGTKNNPWQIKINMNWMNTTDPTDYSDVFDSIKRIFKETIDEDYGGCYSLEINQIPGTSDYNAVYDTMKHGEYDLGFGAISGNDLNPINFFEVLKSDNSSDFTLNWGHDTSKVSNDVVYDGKTWSFDSLWKASDTGVALASDGSIASVANASTANTTTDGTKYTSINATDHSSTYTLSFKTLVEGGAQDILVYVKNASVSIEGKSLADLGITAATSYKGNVVLPKSLNVYTTTSDKGEDVDHDCLVATITVEYNISINGTTTALSSSIKLPTYYGITGIANSK